MSGFMRRDPKRGDGGRVVNVGREMELLARRIVVVAEKIVRLHDLHVVDPGRRQNFAGCLSASNIRSGPDRPPFLKSAADAKLRDQPDDERYAHQEKPVRSKTVTVNVSQCHVCLVSRCKTKSKNLFICPEVPRLRSPALHRCKIRPRRGPFVHGFSSAVVAPLCRGVCWRWTATERRRYSGCSNLKSLFEARQQSVPGLRHHR